MKLTSLLVLSSAATMNAAVLVNEDFSYADGDLTTVGAPDWTAHSGATGTLLQVSGGAAVITHGGGSREDANIGFGAIGGPGLLTASFDLVVSDDAPIVGSDFEYFAHFFSDGAFDFRSRTDIVEPTAGGDFALGIATTSSTADSTTSIDFSFDTVIPVEITLNFDGAEIVSTLTAGGETITGTTVTEDASSLSQFALRASGSSSNETVTVDNLVIDFTAAIPEPSSALLAGLGFLGLLRRRR